MPHINRIRVNNVKYNFGTQFYDDFIMRFYGKNAIYDLANGGGKSVLMLLLMQNLIPNCTLDEKQPLEKLFRTNEGSTTIHSMVEWILSDVHIRNEFKYMLTGFCARRAKDTGEENKKNTAEIEYFNYCIFYRKYNDNDIKNLPLSKDGERITYTGLRNYLKELSRNDYNLEVHIFEKKGEYQKFISRYGLYESHWEIVRGINKTEGHVRTYFETHYRTARKVVEDLLIEEIIQKSFSSRYNSGDEQDNMAKTLLDIKDKLLELSEKKEQLHNYDRQIEMLNSFSERVKGIRRIYIGMEDLELELSKAYNTLMREEQEKKQSRVSEADKKVQLLSEKNNLNRRVDTAKVMKKSKELDGYKNELKECRDVISEKQQDIKRITDELTAKECGNDYLDYISCKAEYDKIKEMLDYALKDKAGLMDELHALTASWKNYYEAQNLKTDKTLENEREILNKEKQTFAQYEEKLSELSNELAILEFKLNDYGAARERILESCSKAKNDAGILIPEAADRQIRDIDIKQSDNEKLKAELEQQLSDLTKKKQQYFYKKQQLLQNRSRTESQIELYRSEGEKFSVIKEKFDSICRVYGQNDISQLQELIRASINDKTSALNDLNGKLKALEARYKAVNDGRMFEEPGCISEILDYIERYHGEKAVSGLEYLKGMEEKEQERVLSLLPIIPYSVIVLKDFDEIISDDKLSHVNKGVYPPALIREDILKKDDIVWDTDNIYFIPGIGNCRKTQVELEKDISELRQNIERQEETRRVMDEDYRLVCKYSLESERWDAVCGSLEELKLELGRNEAELAGLDEEASQWDNSLSKISEKLENVKKEMAENSRQQLLLKEVREYHTELHSIEENILKCTSEADSMKREKNSLDARTDSLGRQMKSRTERIDLLEKEKNSMEKEWTDKYLPYYIEGSSSSIVNTDNLKARLDGALEAVVREDSGLEDRRKLLGNYKNSMDKAIKRIEYQGGDVEKFRKLFEENQLMETSPQQLNDIKKSRAELNSVMDTLVLKEKELMSKCDRQEGNISNAIQVISEKYGYYEEEHINQEDIDVFIAENAGLLKKYQQDLKASEERIESLDKDINRYLIVRRDIESRMEMEGISARDTKEYFDRGINIEDKCSEILKKHEVFRNDVLARREDFIHEKQMLIDTMKSIGGDALSEEIRISVSMPSDYKETDSLIEMFGETVECLKLEKDMVGRGIEDMEKIKENFEKQCLQNCLNIKTELERLPKLSKIIMEGEVIQIINLKIPYVSEGEYTGRMSGYIDDIAAKADDMQNTEERMKYIRNRLSWKKLFSVIVADMNGIKLNLYKRERIKEQSRYLPYEEAVGSTGQSQGIYIQFLISVINYISSINSGNSDASNLRKTVFLDNPFGAAKDVYIWEPIFKLLKTNNVQLIVPARGATPAITGRFDVNYVLGQKMTGKRQQTVVTDYFSNVESEELEYTKMSYEQTSLF